MKIVILNECFLGDQHLKRLRDLGEVEIFYKTTTEEDAIERLKGADVALGDCFVVPFNKRVLESTDNLKLLVVNSTGYSLVDINAATEKGIKVANTPGYSTESVAELAITLMMAVNRKVVFLDNLVKKNPFEVDLGNKEQEKYWGSNIRGKTLGVIGLGRIGQRVAEIGKALGMQVLGFNRTPKEIVGVKSVSLEELLIGSDVVSINLAVNEETKNLISRKEIDLMKNAAIIISITAEEHVVVEDLYQALKEGRIAGAGLDGIDGIRKGHPIFKLDNIVLTPRVGFATNESVKENLPDIIVEDVESFLSGTPKNIVN